jgi:hypothetical protein
VTLSSLALTASLLVNTFYPICVSLADEVVTTVQEELDAKSSEQAVAIEEVYSVEPSSPWICTATGFGSKPRCYARPLMLEEDATNVD